MALKSTYVKFGVAFQDAYTRVQNVEYSNSIDQNWELSEDPSVPPVKVFTKMLKVAFVANTYASDAATQDELLNSKQYHIVVSDGSNIVGSCYDHLVSLPEFDGAVSA